MTMYSLPDSDAAFREPWVVLWSKEFVGKIYDRFLGGIIQLVFRTPGPEEDCEDQLLLVSSGAGPQIWTLGLESRRMISYIKDLKELESAVCCSTGGSTVAVSVAPVHFAGCDPVPGRVVLYHVTGTSWTRSRTIVHGAMGFDRPLFSPGAVRVQADGKALAVIDQAAGDALLFTSDGTLLTTLCGPVDAPLDIEECRGGWLLLDGATRTVRFLGGSQYLWDTLGNPETGLVPGYIETLTLVPGVGLFLTDRCRDRQFHVFLDTPDFYGCKVDYPPQRGLKFELETLECTPQRLITMGTHDLFAVCKASNLRASAMFHQIDLELPAPFKCYLTVLTSETYSTQTRIELEGIRHVGMITFWEPDSDGCAPPLLLAAGADVSKVVVLDLRQMLSGENLYHVRAPVVATITVRGNSGKKLCTVMARGSTIVIASTPDDDNRMFMEVYTGHDGVWTFTATLYTHSARSGFTVMARTMAFSPDGTCVAVMDFASGTVKLMRLIDGKLVARFPSRVYITNYLDTCTDGWISVSRNMTLRFFSEHGTRWTDHVAMALFSTHDSVEFAALIPGTGLVTKCWSRQNTNRAHIIVFPFVDSTAMNAMSPERVAWMGVVARALLRWGC